MKPERIEATWLEEHHLLSIGELDERWGLSSSQLHEFIAHGVLEPIPTQAGGAAFSLEAVSLVRTACRLQQELELEPHAVGVVLELLQRVRALENELATLRGRLAVERAPDDEPPEAELTSATRP